MLAATRSAADALRSRVTACGAPGAAEVQVCTPMQFFEQVLSCPEARAFTGRTPRLLADFEERILMEDMKTCGLKPKRLREMLKFFFRQWTELGDEREGFLVEDDEHLVHDSIMRHLRLRNAMLPAELGNLTVKFLRDAPDAPAWCRRAHVLADDYQDYARATQLALDLIAREGLMVCGNVNEQVVTPDPYPYPEGLAGFASTHDGTEAIVLTEGLRCPARIAAVGNGLAQAGDMDERTLVSAGEAAEGGEANGTAGSPERRVQGHRALSEARFRGHGRAGAGGRHRRGAHRPAASARYGRGGSQRAVGALHRQGARGQRHALRPTGRLPRAQGRPAR